MSRKADSQTAALHAEIIEALPRVRRFARGLAGNVADADDLLQATVERTLSRARPANLDVARWMFRVCRNLWIDEIRARNVRRDAAPRVAAEDEQVIGDDAAVLGTLGAEEVMSDLSELPDEQRAVLVLVAVEGFAYREAAEVLEIPIGTVMSRLSRARATLSERLRGSD